MKAKQPICFHIHAEQVIPDKTWHCPYFAPKHKSYPHQAKSTTSNLY